MGHIVMLAAHQLAVPDKKDLDDTVRVRILLFHRDSKDIPVLTDTIGHFLFLGDLLYILQQISPADRLLKAHLFRCLLHFFRQVA